MAHARNLSILEAEAGGLRAQPQLHGELQVSKSHLVKPCLIRKEKTQNFKLKNWDIHENI